MNDTVVSKIEEAFDSHKIKYRTIEAGEMTFVEAGFNIDGGPDIRAVFIPCDKNGNGVNIRIAGIMHHAPKEKRPLLLEACNRINSEMRFFKYFLDKDNDIVGQCDLPSSSSADTVGEYCSELFIRAMQIMNQCYHYFPEAVYGGAANDKLESLKSALTSLQDLRDHPITIPEDQQKD